MSYKVQTEFEFKIGDVVRLKAWAYTVARDWSFGPAYAPDAPSCVYRIVELLAQICEGGLQRKYGTRAVTGAGNCAKEHTVFVESELELAEPLPVRPAEKGTDGNAKV